MARGGDGGREAGAAGLMGGAAGVDPRGARSLGGRPAQPAAAGCGGRPGGARCRRRRPGRAGPGPCLTCRAAARPRAPPPRCTTSRSAPRASCCWRTPASPSQRVRAREAGGGGGVRPQGGAAEGDGAGVGPAGGRTEGAARPRRCGGATGSARALVDRRGRGPPAHPPGPPHPRRPPPAPPRRQAAATASPAPTVAASRRC
jgi:hypothetical protein